MINLRNEMSEILEEYGHPILLVKQNKTVRCTCWNELYGTANSKCPYCFGLGYLYEITKHMCRSDTESIPETLPRSMSKQEPGILANTSKVFYLKNDTFPQSGDLIVETSWNGLQPIIDEYTAVYEINYPEPQRGDQGRIEYFRAACAKDPINAKIRIKTIANKYYLGLQVEGA